MKLRKMKEVLLDRKNFVMGMLVIIAISLLCIAYKVKGSNFYDDFVVGSLFPEAIGVVIELAFVYLIFSWIERKRQSKYVEENERRSRSYLRFFIVDLMRCKLILDEAIKNDERFLQYKFEPERFKFYSNNVAENILIIDGLIVVLKSLDPELISNHIRKHTELEINSIQSMLPVVSGVTSEHFKIWQRMIFFMSLIVRSETVVKNTIIVLEKIKRFDQKTLNRFSVKQKT